MKIALLLWKVARLSSSRQIVSSVWDVNRARYTKSRRAHTALITRDKLRVLGSGRLMINPSIITHILLCSWPETCGSITIPLVNSCNLVIRWQCLAAWVNCCWAIDIDQLFNHVLYHSLKELMENVRCDRDEYFGKWKQFPKGLVNGLEACLMAGMVKCMDIVVIC